jgi:hypothetical protein
MSANKKKGNLPEQKAASQDKVISVKATDRFVLRRFETFGDDLTIEQFKKLREGESVKLKRSVLERNRKHLTEA